MQITFQSLAEAFAAMPAWEFVAVLFGIAYILLAARESIWTWFFGFFSTLIYTILFWNGALLSSALLNFYYMAMALYGYYLWSSGGIEDQTLQIRSLTLSMHSKIVAVGLIASLLLGDLSSTYTDARYTYLDSFVMLFSMIATWMLAKKIMENWLYWIVVDSAAIWLYWKSGYLVTILLFALYVILAFYGYRTWRKRLREYE